MDRKSFVKTALTGAAFGLIGPGQIIGRHVNKAERLDPVLVQEFVNVAHGNMAKVKELLAEHPNLLNAAHDWKHGDFETALGAASHVGHKELAAFLLERGAQANIFTACLFGKIEVLRAMLEAFPDALNAKGPHGLTLLHHAEKGGDEALEVKELLLEKGLTEMQVPLY